MMRNAIVGLAIGASLVAGCKKKAADSGGGGTGTGSGIGTAEPAAPRPSQGHLEAMPPPPAQPDDPKRDAKVALGHMLFFDKRMSVDGSRACYSCHQNEDGLGGHDPIAIGAGDKTLTRHAPVLWNMVYLKGAFYWDGRAKSLEENAKMAWGGGNMGVGNDKLDDKAKEMAAIAGYKPLFAAAFGDAPATGDQVAEALADYERTFVCDDTAYDKFAKGDKSALNEQQQRGLDVFLGKGGCNACHTPPHFSLAMQAEGGAYFNAGIGIANHADADVDPGHGKVTGKPEDWATFKIPSLRNVAKSPPYFHDGSRATLEDAVKYMSSGATPNKNLSALLADKKLTDGERADLVAFLHGLDCPGSLEEPKLP